MLKLYLEEFFKNKGNIKTNFEKTIKKYSHLLLINQNAKE